MGAALNSFCNKMKVIAILLLLSSCASNKVLEGSDSNIDNTNDPFEHFNRFVFAVNQTFDKVLFEPVARGYRYITPDGMRSAVNNFFSNLSEPVSAINHVLSGNFEEAGTNMTRFMINSTYGIAGLNDIASDFDLKPDSQDFGKTLATWGVGEGPYVMLPVLGGHNARDAVGVGVDYFIDPVNIATRDMDNTIFFLTIPRGIAKREQYLDLLAEMEKDSLDLYVTMREFTRQNRRFSVNRNNTDDLSAFNFDMDSFEDEEE